MQLLLCSGVFEAMKSPIRLQKPVRSLIFTVVFFTVAVSLVVAIAIPNFVRSGPGRLNGIVNTLRQIDGAKQQWAFERGITNVAQATNELTDANVSAYLSGGEGRKNRDGFGFDRSGRPYSGAGEEYRIKPLNTAPEAYLTKDFKEGRGSSYLLPKGTTIRLTDSDYEIILPNGTRIRH